MMRQLLPLHQLSASIINWEEYKNLLSIVLIEEIRSSGRCLLFS